MAALDLGLAWFGLESESESVSEPDFFDSVCKFQFSLSFKQNVQSSLEYFFHLISFYTVLSLFSSFLSFYFFWSSCSAIGSHQKLWEPKRSTSRLTGFFFVFVMWQDQSQPAASSQTCGRHVDSPMLPLDAMPSAKFDRSILYSFTTTGDQVTLPIVLPLSPSLHLFLSHSIRLSTL